MSTTYFRIRASFRFSQFFGGWGWLGIHYLYLSRVCSSSVRAISSKVCVGGNKDETRDLSYQYRNLTLCLYLSVLVHPCCSSLFVLFSSLLFSSHSVFSSLLFSSLLFSFSLSVPCTHRQSYTAKIQKGKEKKSSVY